MASKESAYLRLRSFLATIGINVKTRAWEYGLGLSAANPAGTELHDLLSDGEFAARTARSRESQLEAAALKKLAQVFADGPDAVLDQLVEATVVFTGADSAGISLLQKDGTGEPKFEWVAIAGTFRNYLHATTPRFFSPCGTCLDRGRAQLYRVDKPYYDFLGVDAEPIREGILIPWINESMSGTLWAVSHQSAVAFDFDDYRLLETLADFASLAVRHYQDEGCRRAEDRLAASATMANHLAHQINNPLQSLTNILYLAQNSGDQAQQYIQQASLELQQITELVGRLLILGKQTGHSEQIDG